MISVHDNLLYAYSVNCESHRIVLHTRFEHGPTQEYTDVIFTGVVAHYFEHVLAGNILFDVTAMRVRDIVIRFASLFAAGKAYGWPDGIEHRDAEDLIRILEGRGSRGFEINSSFGMSGWVIGEAMKLLPRSGEADAPAARRPHSQPH